MLLYFISEYLYINEELSWAEGYAKCLEYIYFPFQFAYHDVSKIDTNEVRFSEFYILNQLLVWANGTIHT